MKTSFVPSQILATTAIMNIITIITTMMKKMAALTAMTATHTTQAPKKLWEKRMSISTNMSTTGLRLMEPKSDVVSALRKWPKKRFPSSTESLSWSVKSQLSFTAFCRDETRSNSLI